MAISQEAKEKALQHCADLRMMINPSHSQAAAWWDRISPAWRGVILHAAAVMTRRDVFKPELSNCCWRELFERLDSRSMQHLRRGIERARRMLSGFGPLPESDFSPRTAERPAKRVNPIWSNHPQSVIAPHIVNKLQQGERE
ncbi:hypothetical protein RJ492_004786 [Pluralibacter gergoviae]|uniref:Uncharacterized protein n=1 Tax=Pluralibacter gergoviae TaxID=61647 RepID=A0AAI9DPX7_PLUGE|nr:hypothetical protein [Pluralibacter gergoviae]EKV0917667.1 hypothetical protein [Pluralibacter gergoviae]EKV9910694.1 hypothetical protein [Pluralibacter gergoviae]EKW7275903.1 hypothetical protein [Pluralibacter gergoviae]ELD4298084.1 hypothetical protein [Pluralibacter gergoviae]ELD4308829.1 hypothetical protein [Pluralibacter gergoviae]